VSVTTEIPRAATRRRWGRVWGLLVALLAAVLVLVPVATAAYVVAVGRHDDRTPTEAIVVLGAAQYWNRPSPVLAARLAHAKSLYRAEVAPRIVTVGGNQPGDNTTEAQAARAWLTGHGVPSSDVIAVPTGADTLTSLQAVAELMAAHGWTSATVVTDPAHEARSLSMSRALGIDAHGSPTQSGAGSELSVDYVARETAGLLAFWFLQQWSVAPVVGAGAGTVTSAPGRHR
jgi:uncharacterized SAM-binding protein YcdF (DUF218 family)